MNLKNEKKTIELNLQDIQRANSTMLYRLLGIGLFCFTLLFLVTFIAETYEGMRIPYLVNLVLMLAIFCVRYFSPKSSTLILLYSTYAVLMGIAIFTSSFITRNSMSALVLSFLFQIPIVILDRSVRINLTEFLFAGVYAAFAFLFKEKHLVMEECINVLLISVIAVFLGGHLRRAQIDNFDLKRQALIRENTDALTGLSNRRKLFDSLGKSEQVGTSMPKGVIMLDIDNFKSYNDAYGHQGGDECLKIVAEALHSLGKEKGIEFFRYGGEEFVGITYEHQGEILYGICQDMAKAIYDMQIPHKEATIPFVTISVGMTCADEKNHAQYERMLYEADLALYSAKNSGKNRAVRYTRSMDTK